VIGKCRFNGPVHLSQIQILAGTGEILHERTWAAVILKDVLPKKRIQLLPGKSGITGIPFP
jgi:hypothetical protein